MRTRRRRTGRRAGAERKAAGQPRTAGRKTAGRTRSAAGAAAGRARTAARAASAAASAAGIPAKHWEPPSAKRVLDLTLGSALLALASPLLGAGALALAARRPPGGVLTRSPRVGLDGRVFVLCSLRTRRLRLDVLSRLPHVVRGDLSLVGPEPLTPEDSGNGGGTDPAGTPASPTARHWRQELKPGLTGLAQVRSRSGMPWDEPALLDQHYAEHHGVGLDLAILASAVRAPLRGALRGLARRGKARLSDTDHRLSGYSTAEEVGSVSTD
ncbi:sugar transferase [Streptomyces sp. NPDC057697]|uniref:sugar transferase n=1 Tax=Streptomyces sp. NPDC057697 TaxID=3346219 RepID=UPI0036B0CC58